MKALVTGGAGFIGYHLCKTLIKKGFSVSMLDNFSDYYSIKIKQKNSEELENLGVKIIKETILNKKILLKILADDYNSVFHLAAQPGVRFSTQNPEFSMKTNIEGTSNVLSACLENQIGKIVIASSSSVFGLQEYLPINEIHPKKPISFYGVSKLAVENMTDVYRYLYKDMDISIIRPFTVVGPRQRPDMAIYKFVSKAINNEKIVVFGDGEQTRDWTHVENIAMAFYLAATKDRASNEDFNIGAGTRISVNDALKLIEDEIGKKISVEYKEYDKADVKDTFADIKKAQNLLDYKPIKSLRIAIKEFIKDYKENIELHTV